MDLIDLTDEEVKRLFEYIGFITVGWGLVERAIDQLVTGTMARGGKELLKKGRRPFGISNKLEYLLRACDKLDVLELQRGPLRGHLEAAKIFSDVRHHLVHGIVESVDDDALVVSKLQLTRAIEYGINQLQLPISSLPEMGMSQMRLAQKLSEIAGRIRL